MYVISAAWHITELDSGRGRSACLGGGGALHLFFLGVISVQYVHLCVCVRECVSILHC